MKYIKGLGMIKRIVIYLLIASNFERLRSTYVLVIQLGCKEQFLTSIIRFRTFQTFIGSLKLYKNWLDVILNTGLQESDI